MAPEPTVSKKSTEATRRREKKVENIPGIWGWIKSNSDALKILFAIIAGLYAVFEYKTKDYVDRVATSSQVAEKFYSSEEYKAFIKMQELLDSDDVREKRAALRRKEISSRNYHEFVSAAARAHRAEFLSSLRGIKAVAVCVMQGRCEPTTICMHLSQPLQEFRCGYRNYIAELSADAATCVVDEMNYFLDNYCSEWLSVYLGVKSYAGIKDNLCLYDKENKTSLIGPECVNSIIYKKWLNPFRKIID